MDSSLTVTVQYENRLTITDVFDLKGVSLWVINEVSNTLILFCLGFV